MTDKQMSQAVVRYVKRWVKRFSLDDWAIVVLRDDKIWDQDEAAMTISPTANYKRATLRWSGKAFLLSGPRVDGDFAWGTPEFSVVHELVHLLVNPINHAGQIGAAMLEEFKHPQASKSLQTMVNDGNEETTERLARLFINIYGERP